MRFALKHERMAKPETKRDELPLLGSGDVTSEPNANMLVPLIPMGSPEDTQRHEETRRGEARLRC